MTMPAIPPVTLKNTASARNCSSTCSRRAPIAMRRPISRVRSVTDTSRMFMMPMPPTRSDRRHRGQQDGHDPAAALRGLGILAEIAHVEVLYVARLDPVAAHERCGRLGDCGLNLILAHRLDVDLIRIAGQSRLQ